MKANISYRYIGFGLILVFIATVMPGYSFSMALEKGKLYFVGVGPAGPEMATLQAIEVIKQADNENRSG